MIDLNAIISNFSKEEQNNFINYLERKNKRNDVKNIQLFKILVKNQLTSKEIVKTLYNRDNKDAYHALRKRLYNSLIDFIAAANLDEENSEKMQIIKYILAARSFLEEQNYSIAFKLLDKAEIIANEHQLFSYLNEIYHIKIQFSYTLTDIELQSMIKLFKKNQQLYYLEEELNIVYAKVRIALNKIAYNGEVINLQFILEKALKEHNISINKSISFKSLYQLLTIASISAFITKDYLQIESFVLKMYNWVKNHKNRNKQAFYHIQVLYMIANTFFRNKKFKESLEFLDLMYVTMQKHKKYYSRFNLKYHMLIALNFNYSNNQEKAINILEQLVNKKHKDIEASLDIHLSLIVFYFQKNELQKANKILSKFYHTDKWYIKKAGKEWVLKKNLIEILLYLELELLDLFESRLLSFRRQYSVYLKEINQERVLTFLKFVEMYYKNEEQIHTTEFKTMLESSFDWIEAKREDIFVMSFYAWLKSKMIKQPLYETTLELIERAKAI